MLQRCKNMGYKPPANSQYFTATVHHTTLWDSTQITSFLCLMVLKRHNNRYFHFSKLWRTFKIGLAASLQILGYFCIPVLQFCTCSGDHTCPWTSKAERVVCRNLCAAFASAWTTAGALPWKHCRRRGWYSHKTCAEIRKDKLQGCFSSILL